MEKREYEAPSIVVYGDVKEITKAGGVIPRVIDNTFTGPDGLAYSSYDS